MALLKVLFSVLLSGIFICYCDASNDIILSDVQVENIDEKSDVGSFVVDNAEPFIPTRDWQVIKPNQAIPAGLHVRMNFQTGIKEAKLLENEDSGKTTEKENSPESLSSSSTNGPKIVLGEDAKNINTKVNEDKIYVTKQQLKDAMHNFKDKIGNKEVDDVTWSSDAKQAMEEEEKANAERIKKKFRSIGEIKSELEEKWKIQMKSDVDVMKEIVQYILAENSTDNEIAAALDNIEYYVHQIDNGANLDKIGGLEPIVHLLNHTNEDIVDKAANVLGAAAQNNVEVQNVVLQYGALRSLLQMLHTEKKPLTKKKAIYALSALIRQNPVAIEELVKFSGVESILNIVQDKSLTTAIHVKALDFLFDLIEEQFVVSKKLKDGNITVEASSVLQILVKGGLCNLLVPILNTDDFYTKEKIMHAIHLSVDSCKDVYKQPENMKVLEKQLMELTQQIKEEDDADFKSYLQNIKGQLEKDIIEKL